MALKKGQICILMEKYAKTTINHLINNKCPVWKKQAADFHFPKLCSSVTSDIKPIPMMCEDLITGKPPDPTGSLKGHLPRSGDSDWLRSPAGTWRPLSDSPAPPCREDWTLSARAQIHYVEFQIHNDNIIPTFRTNTHTHTNTSAYIHICIHTQI